MIYKNKEKVDSICTEIKECMEELNDLCVGAQSIRIQNSHGHPLFTIAVEPDSGDEYAHQGMVLINYIKDDLKRKIADLHTELKLL